MEESRRAVCQGKSHNHQSLDMAAGSDIRPGVPHPTAGRHLPPAPLQQGSQTLDSYCVCVMRQKQHPGSGMFEIGNNGIWPCIK